MFLRHQGVYTVWFQFYEVQEQAKQINDGGNQYSYFKWGWEEFWDLIPKNWHEKNLERGGNALYFHLRMVYNTQVCMLQNHWAVS